MRITKARCTNQQVSALLYIINGIGAVVYRPLNALKPQVRHGLGPLTGRCADHT